MIPDSEKGDEDRMHIGGVDSLYRAHSYNGAWDMGQRAGQGQVMYSDGSSKIGNYQGSSTGGAD